MFIPGAYHVRIAYYAYRKYPGFSFDDIPEFEWSCINQVNLFSNIQNSKNTLADTEYFILALENTGFHNRDLAVVLKFEDEFKKKKKKIIQIFCVKWKIVTYKCVK